MLFFVQHFTVGMPKPRACNNCTLIMPASPFDRSWIAKRFISRASADPLRIVIWLFLIFRLCLVPSSNLLASFFNKALSGCGVGIRALMISLMLGRFRYVFRWLRVSGWTANLRFPESIRWATPVARFVLFSSKLNLLCRLWPGANRFCGMCTTGTSGMVSCVGSSPLPSTLIEWNLGFLPQCLLDQLQCSNFVVARQAYLAPSFFK